MQFDEKLVSYGSRQFVVAGDKRDSYFASCEQAIQGLTPFSEWAKQLLHDDSIVIDVGGNIGLTTIILSSLVPNGHVHVFEASPKNAAALRQTISRNNLRNCTVNEMALGNRAGEVSILEAGSASHLLLAQHAVSGQAQIPILTLDEYVERKELQNVDLIKIDVEGVEPLVIEGAERTLTKFRPPVFMEFNSWCLTYIHGFDARNFANLLWAAFTVRSVSASGHENTTAGGDVVKFFHDNIVKHGAVEDVVLYLKPGSEVPKAGERFLVASQPVSRQPEIDRLVSELAAIRQSRSWRLTAPIRYMINFIRTFDYRSSHRE